MYLMRAVVYMYGWVAYREIEITRAATMIMGVWARLNMTGTSITY